MLPQFVLRHDPVGASLLAKRPVQTKHSCRLQLRLRQQAGSHSLCCATILWERACSRRGRYRRNIHVASKHVFASKLPPTVCVVPRSCESKLAPTVCVAPRSCESKLPPTVCVVPRSCGSELACEEAGTDKAFTSPSNTSSPASWLPHSVLCRNAVGASLLAKRPVQTKHSRRLQTRLRQQAGSHTAAQDGFAASHLVQAPKKQKSTRRCFCCAEQSLTEPDPESTGLSRLRESARQGRGPFLPDPLCR